jgi:hypothetical protein
MLRTESSPCNLQRQLGKAYPNNDFAVDNVAAIFVHELGK